MLLSELIQTVGQGPVAVRHHGAVDPDLDEVLLDDGVSSLGPGKIVLAVLPGQEQSLLESAKAHGCQAVVVSASAAVDDPADITVLETSLGWTQLFVLLRTMLLSSHDEASNDAGPGSVHGLADAVAIMVGGSVVLYDRAHRVIAYSVQGHEIDSVRRDTILGRRTPDQWIRRFTVDRTAYETYAKPGSVVRMADYADLHTRLRIAVHAGGETIGEISVAEGSEPFAAHAEGALQRAAELAVPVMLRHHRSQNVERIARESTVRALLSGSPLPAQRSHEVPFDSGSGIVPVGFALTVRDAHRIGAVEDVTGERFVHFLTLHMRSAEPTSLVAKIDDTYWALVPGESTSSEHLRSITHTALAQLSRMGVRAHAAIGTLSDSREELPFTSRVVLDLLDLGADSHGQVLMPETNWAQLVLAAAQRGIRESGALPDGPLTTIRDHDRKHETAFMETLTVFLEEFGSVSAAATRLYLHPNTLRHRMQRIREISGLDLSDSDQRLAVSLHLDAAAKHRRRCASGES
ncbi:PucR family transcriptional regulator [Brevibacterium album]|uniref:PucR family transcriptional regulator n=1 Tax=Brevibacterium album TaxID=417948 RepID=UPI000401EF20|nr:helix-turn-helix domain-containing protein [Brevibacterium album]